MTVLKVYSTGAEAEHSLCNLLDEVRDPLPIGEKIGRASAIENSLGCTNDRIMSSSSLKAYPSQPNNH